MRPLFAYGGTGDMNSLIAKSIYAYLNNHDDLDMFLNPSKIKDYLHVEDFCRAVVCACTEGLWGNDYNVAAETPHVTLKIVEMMADIVNSKITKILKWHPETDYLGNHMLSSEKFKKASGWVPKISLRQGIHKVYGSIIKNDESYNPLVHLNRAKLAGIDLTEFYNSSRK
jgi:dTDP-D-glucose 4,6-dehydratase